MANGRVAELLEVRKNFYSFLERAFAAEPSREIVEMLLRGEIPLPDESELVGEKLSDGVKLIKEYVRQAAGPEEAYRELVDDFTELFLDPFEPKVYPYESMYVDGHMLGRPLVAVKEFLARTAIKRGPTFRDPEDHVAFELGVMRHLCEEAASHVSDRRKLVELLKLQKEFLETHLLNWVPQLCSDLFLKSKTNFYRGVAKLAEGFLELEKELINFLLLELSEDIA